jgi:hypothetical protein
LEQNICCSLPSLKLKIESYFFSNLKENKTLWKSDCLYLKQAHGSGLFSFFISFTYYVLKLLENNSTHSFEKGHCVVEWKRFF